jgi:signal transduction histidine kinase
VSDERSRWRVQTIVEQIDRITNIMHALLNLARPRAPVVAPVDVGAVIETAVSFLREKLARRGIDVELQLGGGWVVRGDMEKLQQLFLNLILNAADAMMEGGTLTLEILTNGDAGIVVVVSDTGVGIEPELLSRIFEPFFTTKQAGHGNGLGLVVARGIAIDHGGDIEVISEPGAGTQFRIELPAVPS